MSRELVVNGTVTAMTAEGALTLHGKGGLVLVDAEGVLPPWPRLAGRSPLATARALSRALSRIGLTLEVRAGRRTLWRLGAGARPFWLLRLFGLRAELTAAGFIQALAWLVQFGARRGRRVR